MSTKDRVRAYRRRMKERGYREIRLWVPDTRSEDFRRYSRESAQRMAEADRHDGSMDFLDEVAWEPPQDQYS